MIYHFNKFMTAIAAIADKDALFTVETATMATVKIMAPEEQEDFLGAVDSVSYAHPDDLRFYQVITPRGTIRGFIAVIHVSPTEMRFLALVL